MRSAWIVITGLLLIQCHPHLHVEETKAELEEPRLDRALDRYTQEAFDVGVLLVDALDWSSDLELLDLSQLIVDKAHEIGVDPLMLLAVIDVESRFDPCARSHRGAKGLMQVMPRRILGVQAVQQAYAFQTHLFFEPHWNIAFGADYLGQLLERFACVDAALAAYNTGPTRVSRWLRNSGALLNTRYPRKVKRRWEELRQELQGAAG